MNRFLEITLPCLIEWRSENWRADTPSGVSGRRSGESFKAMVQLSHRDLSDREKSILKEVISAYILRAEPVSSRTVAKQRREKLSAATIRNTMADLEEWGFLSQPHASAGRIPTPEGYHFFIESLMREKRLAPEDQRYIEENLGKAGDAESLTLMASHLLSDLSDQVGVVLTPARGDAVLRTMDFVPLSGSKVLCVVVSAMGFIDNKVIDIEEKLPREELTRIANYLTENFAGLTLSEVRNRLLALMADDKVQVDSLMQRAIVLGRYGVDSMAGPEVLVEGAEALLNKPELKDLLRIRRLFEAFADKAQLVMMLNKCMEGKGVRVFIGKDSHLTSELDFSLVATTYGVGDTALGSLGIFGPSRMEYPRLVPLVHFLGDALSASLERGALGSEAPWSGRRR